MISNDADGEDDELDSINSQETTESTKTLTKAALISPSSTSLVASRHDRNDALSRPSILAQESRDVLCRACRTARLDTTRA